MFRVIKYFLLILTILFVLYFPFFHIGGDYYRGIIGIWYKYKYIHTPDFNPIQIPDYTFYSPLLFADPTSFHYVDDTYGADRFYVYAGDWRIPDSDGKTFRSLGNGCYVDKYNARCPPGLMLKKTSSDSQPESFDVETFQRVIFTCYEYTNEEIRNLGECKKNLLIVKDKTGIYRSGTSSFAVEKIHGLETDFPVFEKVQDIDDETFEARSISRCHWDEKERKYVYKDECVLMDKNFIYETESEGCKMTGKKFPKNSN